MDDDLKPCPHCGPGTVVQVCDELDGKYFFVACGACGSSSGHRSIRQRGNAREMAIQAWNTRKTETANDARIADLEQALNEIASWTQSTSLLWWQEKARAALSKEGQHDPCH